MSTNPSKASTTTARTTNAKAKGKATTATDKGADKVTTNPVANLTVDAKVARDRFAAASTGAGSNAVTVAVAAASMSVAGLVGDDKGQTSYAKVGEALHIPGSRTGVMGEVRIGSLILAGILPESPAAFTECPRAFARSAACGKFLAGGESGKAGVNVTNLRGAVAAWKREAKAKADKVTADRIAKATTPDSTTEDGDKVTTDAPRGSVKVSTADRLADVLATLRLIRDDAVLEMHADAVEAVAVEVARLTGALAVGAGVDGDGDPVADDTTPAPVPTPATVAKATRTRKAGATTAKAAAAAK